jgi:hypothetical protein
LQAGGGCASCGFRPQFCGAPTSAGEALDFPLSEETE